MNGVDLAKRILQSVDNKSPIILSGLAIAGVLSTTIMAIKATPDAINKIDWERRRRLLATENDEFEYVDPRAEKLTIIRLTWQSYIPTASMGLITIACIVGSQSINSKRQAALIGGFTLVEGAFREYREKVIDQLGNKTDQKVRDSIAQDRVTNNPASSQVIITGMDQQLCYDPNTDRYFKSDMETIRRAVNDINHQCLHNMYASQNDFFRLIGLGTTTMGEEFGWTTDVMLDIDFTTTLSAESIPCIVINYRLDPTRNFYKVN